ncbi:MAG: caspase family protein [Rubrivivax sp.]|nr:caspase family protein [Rubrivivax sp.]
MTRAGSSSLRPAARWLLAAALVVLSATAAAQPCSSRLRITLGDGSASCLTDHALAQRTATARPGTLASLLPVSGLYAVAVSPALPQCPAALGFSAISTMPTATGAVGNGADSPHARSALAECRQKLPWSAPPECSCRLVLVDGLSTLPPESFARYAGTAPAVVAAAPPPAPEQAAAAPAEPAVTEVRPPPGNGEVAALRRRIEQLQAEVGQAQAARSPPAAATPVNRLTARALVIGNGAYKHLGTLANPRRDAMDMAAKLRGFGIEVDLVLDADRHALVKALADHNRKATALDVNILYYAGHGLQVGGINYIAPVDMLADGISSGHVKLNGVALNDALDYLPARTRLVFLDACRDNPAVRKLVANRSVAAPGLAPVSATSGTLIAYATRDGSVAEDGKGRNSPYTAALLRHLDAPDDIAVVLRRVRQSVMEATGNRQEPWEYGSLVGDQLVLSRLVR